VRLFVACRYRTHFCEIVPVILRWEMISHGGNGGGGEFAMQPMLLLIGSQCLECNLESPGKTHPAE